MCPGSPKEAAWTQRPPRLSPSTKGTDFTSPPWPEEAEKGVESEEKGQKGNSGLLHTVLRRTPSGEKLSPGL
jgi:hypothetical protein